MSLVLGREDELAKPFLYQSGPNVAAEILQIGRPAHTAKTRDKNERGPLFSKIRPNHTTIVGIEVELTV